MGGSKGEESESSRLRARGSPEADKQGYHSPDKRVCWPRGVEHAPRKRGMKAPSVIIGYTNHQWWVLKPPPRPLPLSFFRVFGAGAVSYGGQCQHVLIRRFASRRSVVRGIQRREATLGCSRLYIVPSSKGEGSRGPVHQRTEESRTGRRTRTTRLRRPSRNFLGMHGVSASHHSFPTALMTGATGARRPALCFRMG